MSTKKDGSGGWVLAAIVLVILAAWAIAAIKNWINGHSETLAILWAQTKVSILLAHGLAAIALIAVSYLAISLIRTTFATHRGDSQITRSLVGSVVLGLVAVAVIFGANGWFLLIDPTIGRGWLAIFCVMAALGGWLVWSVSNIEIYGDFLYVLLMTIVVGLSWYARLVAPGKIEWIVYAFVLASIARLSVEDMKAAHLRLHKNRL